MTLETTASQALPFTGFLVFCLETYGRSHATEGLPVACLLLKQGNTGGGGGMPVYLKAPSGIRIRDAVTHALDSTAAIVAIKCLS
jgi:hypothetical protein